MLNPIDHILQRPDMYIGTNTLRKQNWWLYDSACEEMYERKIYFSPAFYKIFDEILVNASDNKIREKEKQTYIRVDACDMTGYITVTNDGVGIPVQFHEKYKLWIPEMIFGHLMTSSNYDDENHRTTGGRYGLGAKLTNVMSVTFKVEVVDSLRKKKFFMRWNNNMRYHTNPEISDVKTPNNSPLKGYTKISFKPDFKFLNMKGGLLRDDLNLLKRRTIDLAGNHGEGLAVFFNNEKIPVHSFADYADLFPHLEKPLVRFRSDHWEIIVASVRRDPVNMSFVNGLCTQKGGTHLDYVQSRVANEIVKLFFQETEILLKTQLVLEHVAFFVKCTINKPTFDSQTKKHLKITLNEFSSLPLLKKLAKELYSDTLLKIYLKNYVPKATEDSSESARHLASESLESFKGFSDAYDAGGPNAQSCTLMLVEGLSAKSFADTGRSILSPEKYGVYALRGKLCNTREMQPESVLANDIAAEIFHILGARMRIENVGGKRALRPSSNKPLRYGKVLVIADADEDGYHITGLILNFFHTFFPSFVKIRGFLSIFRTPLIKAVINGAQVSFYTQEMFESCAQRSSSRYSSIRYYKGLGTNTEDEAKSYFSRKDNHITELHFGEDDDRCMEMFYGSGKTSRHYRRKLLELPPQELAFRQNCTFSEFHHTCVASFGRAVCLRMIPSVADGLNESQRKILWTMLSGNFKNNQWKVTEVAGYVTERMNYHHGDASLNSTIRRMALGYVGANNVPLLVADGNFGSRYKNGADGAAPRYISTKLQDVTRKIFRLEDDEFVASSKTWSVDKEPEHLYPIVPMCLVNGQHAVAYGCRSVVPNHSLSQVVDALLSIIQKKAQYAVLNPHWEGFRGKVRRLRDRVFTSGVVSLLNEDTLLVSEIPIGKSIRAYAATLTDLVNKKILRSFKERHQQDNIRFILRMNPQILEICVRARALKHVLSLISVQRTSYAFMDGKKVVFYKNASDVLIAYYKKRLAFLYNRKRIHTEQLDDQIRIAKDQIIMHTAYLKNSIDLFDPEGLRTFFKQHNMKDDNDYAHLLNLSIGSLSESTLSMRKLSLEALEKMREAAMSTSPEDDWISKLGELKKAIPQRSKPVENTPAVEPYRPCTVPSEALINLGHKIRAMYARLPPRQEHKK